MLSHSFPQLTVDKLKIANPVLNYGEIEKILQGPSPQLDYIGSPFKAYVKENTK